jgi:DNA polymerase III subunit epsilon
MPKMLVIDVETNGLFDFKKPADAEGQPRMASIAMIAVDENGQEEMSPFDFMIRPDGWEMTPEGTAINGLTTEYLMREGVPIAEALDYYEGFVKARRVICAFNAQNDCKQMRAELRRAGRPDLFEETPNICLMRACHPLNIPKANGKRGWPKLSDAYLYFTGEQLVTPHGALADAQAAVAVLQGLIRAGALPEPAVHYAANPPGKAKEGTE